MNLSKPCKPAIIVFPGSNCDRDMEYALQYGFKLEPLFLWHMVDAIPDDITHVIIPGGFSYGDYVRAGAMAAQSPIMQAVSNFAARGGRILGVCNGFQILCECGFLPGILMKNNHDRFVCRIESITWFGMSSPYTPITLQLPIAHREGRFFAETSVIKQLRASGAIAMTYNRRDEQGHALVNGSYSAIAGLIGGQNNNILGLMPHPERAMEGDILGNDGRVILQEFLFG